MSLNGGFVIAICLLTAVLIKKGGPKAAFHLMIALLPATGFFVDVGISLSASKIIGLVLSLFLVKLWLWKGVQGQAESLGIAFLAYAGIMTVAGRFFAPEVTTFEASEFRVFLRPLVQWLGLGLQMLPLFLAPHLLRSRADCGSALKALFLGSGLLAVGAIVQWFIYLNWQVNIFPVFREGIFGETKGMFGDDTENSEFGLGDEVIFRANSLAREPKDLGAALAAATVLWSLFRSARLIGCAALSFAYIGTLFVAMVLSFSTSAAFLLAIGMIVLPFAALSMRLVGKTSPQRLEELTPPSSVKLPPFLKGGLFALSLMIITAAIPSTYGIVQGAMPTLTEILNLRVFDRVGNVEDYDEVALEFLANEPQQMLVGVGTGNIPWYGNKYLPAHPDASYMYNLTWNAKSGFLTVVTSYGVIGMLLLIVLVSSIVWQLGVALRRYISDAPLIVASIASLLAITAIYGFRSIDELLWLSLGVGLAYARSFSAVAGNSSVLEASAASGALTDSTVFTPRTHTRHSRVWP